MKKLFFGLLFFVSINASAQSPFQNKIKVLHRFLQQQHYSPIAWSDSLVNIFFDKWITTLDEEKIFFSQEDIKALSTYKKGIISEVKGQKAPEFLEASLKLFFKKTSAADSITKSFASNPINFTRPDDLQWPQTKFASNAAEINARWQKYIKWQVLTDIAGSVEDTLNFEKTFLATLKIKEAEARASVMKKEASYFDKLTDKESRVELMNAYLNDIIWCYDPHSNYLDMSSRREFDALVSASEYTIGLDLVRGDKGELLIEYLEPGGSAWRNGKLHAGDQIIKIKLGVKEYLVERMEDAEISNLFTGKDNEAISITVKTRTGEQKRADLLFEKITDEESVVKSYVIQSEKNIGYINLPGFYSRENMEQGSFDGCANDVSKEIIKLKKDNIAALILDLRDNGGGSVWEAMQLAGIFIDVGPVATIKSKDEKQSILKDPNRGSIYDGPMIVLINGGSASASEFTAAALQDHNRAIIMGEMSYGKGTAQVVLPLDTLTPSNSKKYEDFVKVTNGKFYRINGNTVQWSAVQPDIAVPTLYADSRSREKDIPTALVPDAAKKPLYTALPVLPITTLAAKSKKRIEVNGYYSKVEPFNKWIKQMSTGYTVALQQNLFAQQYESLHKKMKQITENPELGSSNKTVVKNNSFDDERIKKSGVKEKEINNLRLKEIKNDNLIFEVGLVLSDWLLLF